MDSQQANFVQLTVFEGDIIKLILEFLEKRDLAISMLSLERETGQVNGPFNEDILFFRQLILEGHWDDALDYLEPLRGPPVELDLREARFLLLKHKYLELLCLRYTTSEIGSGTAGHLINGTTTADCQEKENSTDFAVEQVGETCHVLSVICACGIMFRDFGCFFIACWHMSSVEGLSLIHI
ncbi:WD repeat-containing protein 47 [Fasciola gigantica]|uniref:WD repeat-containing protein 47 n=1 Tax=Fasciola gigantica TaxID=46835 RepID=A0A504YA12_FASGI|nr:WD repeat-containing protein 47 [Fasciola gigantica]